MILLTDRAALNHFDYYDDFEMYTSEIKTYLIPGKAATNKMFGNRLAEGITIGYKSLSAVVPAEEYNSAFSCYLHFSVIQLALVMGFDILKYQPIAKP